jgi:glycosyltransferase involved in cell wall biosynthesis
MILSIPDFPLGVKGKYLLISIVLSELNPSTLTDEIVTALVETNVKANLFTFDDLKPELLKSLKSANCQIKYFRSSSRNKPVQIATWLIQLTFYLLKNNSERVYSSGRTASLVGMTAAFFARIPTRVFTRHHGSENHILGLKRGILIDRVTNLFASKIVAVSQVCKETMITRDRCDPQKIIVIHNGINADSFSRMSRHFGGTDNSEKKSKKDEFTIGLISRCVSGKGIGVALSAFAILLRDYPNAKLRMLGEGNLSAVDEFRVNELIPIRNFCRVLESNNITSEYQTFDLFLHLPEYEDYESFGLVYLEAIASGVPSIFTQSGILSEISCPGFVQVVKARDVNETYTAILEFCKKRPQSSESDAKLVTSRFTIEQMRTNYSEVLKA